jgi:acetyl esterase/lipase
MRTSMPYRALRAWLACFAALSFGTALAADAPASPAWSTSAQGADAFLTRTFAEGHPIDTGAIRRKWLDLPYATISPAEKLDIFLPEDGNGPFPVVVAIHGGSFKSGDKRDFQIAPMLKSLRNGYAVVSINYRLTPEALFPGQIQDVKAAIRWIRAHAGEYALEPRKIALWGDSAGGYLAALAGTSALDHAFDDPALGESGQSTDVSAVVDWYGPADFAALSGIPRMKGVGRRLFGKTPSEAPGLYAAADPGVHITPKAPPILIQHGDRDRLVPHDQSLALARRYRDLAGPGKVTLDILQGADHLDAAFASAPNLARVLRFLDRNLKETD